MTPPSPASVINYTWDDPSRKDDLTARDSDSFSWDYEDRMVSATVNSVTTNFTYRGDGLRDSRAVSGGATTTFTWDVASGLPVVLDDGNQYLYGAGLTAQKQSGSWYYYLADGLGSTMAAVNASGAVQDSYTFDVYGTPTKTGSLANEFDFAGQQTDGTGLQYLRARYYDPATGTFLSREPLALSPSNLSNPFAYGKASPTRFSDRSGLYPTDGCDLDCGLSNDAPTQPAQPGRTPTAVKPPYPCGTPTPSNPTGCDRPTGGLGWKPVEVAVGTVLVIDGIALLIVSPEAAAAANGVLTGIDAARCFNDQSASACQWLLLDLTGIGIGEYAAKGIRAFKLSGPNTVPIERQASKIIADGWNFCQDYCDDAIDWTSWGAAAWDILWNHLWN